MPLSASALERKGGPSVSVITPAYNAAPYLSETIRSVLAQSFSDFELLIVDDGSTDDTQAVARAFADQDPRVRLIATPNRGPAAARNTALQASRGRLLALLDSDDIWSPDYLTEQLALFQAIPEASIVTANALNRGGGFDGRPIWPITSGVRRVTLVDVINQEDSVCIMAVFRREVYEKIGGFDPHFTGNEDYHFWLRAARAGFVIVQNRTPLAIYRRRNDSVSANEPRMVRGILAVLEDADHFCADLPVEQSAIRRQANRFRSELARAELRESLRNCDTTSAVRVLKTLSGVQGGWVLPAIARFSAVWPQPLLWAYRLRRAVRA
jgi:GT2 family glycosyltransferase